MNVQASHHPPLAVLNITPHAFYLLVFVFVFQPRAFAQNDSLAGFDQEQAITHASYANSEVQKERILRATERQFIKQKFFSPLKPAKHEEVISVEETLANCDNIGFENGSVAGWTVKGDYVVTAVGNDGFGGFPRVFPGGKHSLQLNNNTIVDKTNFDASASKLFRVTPGNTSLNLHFAMVILNYPHDSYSAARFNITLRDCTNHVDLCSRFSCYYDAGIGPVGASNFSVSAKKGENTGHETFDVTYAPWQTIGIDLSPHTGKDIAVQISCNWCIPRVDWAYCYIDADCGTATVKQFPCRKMPSSLSGPPGFQTYKWTLPGGQIVTSPSSSLAIDVPGSYTLRCNQSPSCTEVPYVYFYNIAEGSNAGFMQESRPCDLNVKLTALDNTPGLVYNWKWQDSMPRVGPREVRHTFNVPGLHWVDLEVTDKSGCLVTSRLTLTLTAPVSVRAVSTDASDKLYGPDDKKNYVALSGYEYGDLDYVWTGENFSEQGKYTSVGDDGRYVVTARDPRTGCIDTAEVEAKLMGWIPNIFTPNNDGVNDQFRFRTKKGMVLSVLDRWGNHVHRSEDVKGIISWDGKNNGTNCSDGVFMYVLLPIDPMPGERGMSGPVTLVR